MGDGHIEKLTAKIRWFIVGWFAASGLLLLLAVWVVERYLPAANDLKFAALGCLWLVVCGFVGLWVADRVSQPLRFLAEAILHISPGEHLVASPNLDKLRLGRELVTTLARQVYEFASAGSKDMPANSNEAIIQQIPLPVLGLGSNGVIVLANTTAAQYSGQEEGVVGKDFYSTYELYFSGGTDLKTWLKTCQESSVSATASWERVRLHIPGINEPKYFDMAASFSKGNPSGAEVLLTLFDHTATYSKEDASISFIALAVHELRTPLTILRGYIEAFDEELGQSLNPEMKTFMQRMEASAETLSAFVSNILNVARVEQNQLSLQLREENWTSLLETIVADMRLRAQVRGISINLQVAPGLPSVAADRVSIAEVVNNLLDNAIKYNKPGSATIEVAAGLNNEGLVETTVRDFGVGIPTGVMPGLFEKFARNHRNRAAVAGTGLGLYLSKALVTAHEGHIWVRSKEGEGTTFGFTLLPYARLAEEQKNSDNSAITRKSHGWIKNHSMYRR